MPGYKNRGKLVDKQVAKHETTKIKERNMNHFTDEKINLMQDKNLLHRFYMMQLRGQTKLTPEENSHIADMILRRKEKKANEKPTWIIKEGE